METGATPVLLWLALWFSTLLSQLSTASGQDVFPVAPSGWQEVPPNVSSGSGSGTLTLNPGNSLSYSVSYQNLQGAFTAAHIHGPAGVGTNAPVLFSLNNPVPIGPESWILNGTLPPLNASQLAALRAGLWYVNIHSTLYTGGELRGQVPPPRPLGIASRFTFQGRVSDNGNAASGVYDLRFALFNQRSGGGQVAPPITHPTVAVNQGLLAVELDFGASAFTGDDRWLEIALRTNGAASFTVLAPRQPVTAAPYALVAGTALKATELSGTYSGAVTLNNAANSFSGTFSGNGAAVSNINATTLGGFGAASFWQREGNSNTIAGTHFLGTADNQPLEFKVNGQRALRLEPNAISPNVIGGYSGNVVGAGNYGSTIGGGGFLNYGNGIFANFATIGGGAYHTLQLGADYATIGGGWGNMIQPNADFATIPGGFGNSATNFAFAAGQRAKANHTGSFVWADSTEAEFASTAANQFLIRASGGVGIGGAPQDALLDVEGDLRVNDHAIWLRQSTDRNHGVGWYTTSSFAGVNPDGPVVFGCAGGTLGTMCGGAAWALTWNSSGNIAVRGTVSQGSDRNAKTDFASVDSREVLEKVAALPVQSWRYKAEAEGVRHLGPVAQDFHAAFGLGDSDVAITTVDESGVALAAIQGLNEKVEVRGQRSEVRMRTLEAENAELKQRLERLEQLLGKITGGAK